MGLDNPLHLAFLLVILLLVFGARRLPEMGRSLGSGLRGFKESINGEAPVTHAEELTPAPVVPDTSAAPGPEARPVAVSGDVARPGAVHSAA